MNKGPCASTIQFIRPGHRDGPPAHESFRSARLRCSAWIQCVTPLLKNVVREAASLGAGLCSGLIAEQADAGPRAGALLALRIGQERENAQPKSEALQSRGSL
jgi:hypothetical protein